MKIIVYGNPDWADRFWSKADKSDANGCWLWKAARDRDGYGSFWLEGRQARAHRVAYALMHPGEEAPCVRLVVASEYSSWMTEIEEDDDEETTLFTRIHGASADESVCPIRGADDWIDCRGFEHEFRDSEAVYYTDLLTFDASANDEQLRFKSNRYKDVGGSWRRAGKPRCS